MNNKRYLEMLGISTFKSKPIRITRSSPNLVLKTNQELVLSYLAYKFLNMEDSPIFISSIIHKPHEILQRDDPEFNIGYLTFRLYSTPDDIYGVIYTTKNLSASVFTSLIVHAYTIFSKLFVKCKIRFISRDPIYVVYQGYHGPEIVVALRDIVSRYGLSNDKLFEKRCAKVFQVDENTIEDHDEIEIT